MDPNTLNKYLYIEKTPAWKVRSFYLYGLVAWFLIVLGFRSAAGVDHFFAWFVYPIILFFTAYHVASFLPNLWYRQLNLAAHRQLLFSYWSSRHEPSVDVFLPICGEDIEILRNTWKHVAALDYRNYRVHVLDDNDMGNFERRQLATLYGFSYLSRRDKGVMKKAGNLKYGFERTHGEFVVIFDADFAPHRDFLRELMPYTNDPKVAIVQSPQYFGTAAKSGKMSALEHADAHSQEVFYRVIQVARDRMGATICCGTNAIYRRAALDEIGGTRQVEHSEDAWTGFTLQSRGWIVRYVPIILAIGLAPSSIYAYFHQRHRWCSGNLELILGREFWTSRLSLLSRLSYLAGFLYYVHYPFAVVLSFQLFWTLFYYGDQISLANGALYYPYLVFSVLYLGWFSIARFSVACLYIPLVQTYSYSHAIFSSLFSSTVGWVPTNTKQSIVSRAFRQTAFAVGTYLFVYAILVAFAIREGRFELFDYNHYSVQFWVFYNLILSGVLLWSFYRTMENVQRGQVAGGVITSSSLALWQFKTAGVYVLLISTVFLTVLYW